MNPTPAAHPEQGPEVEIVINTTPYRVHRGRTTVAELKELAHIPKAYELEEVVAGVLKPLADDGAVTLKGGEHFVAHPRDGVSS